MRRGGHRPLPARGRVDPAPAGRYHWPARRSPPGPLATTRFGPDPRGRLHRLHPLHPSVSSRCHRRRHAPDAHGDRGRVQWLRTLPATLPSRLHRDACTTHAHGDGAGSLVRALAPAFRGPTGQARYRASPSCAASGGTPGGTWIPEEHRTWIRIHPHPASRGRTSEHDARWADAGPSIHSQGGSCAPAPAAGRALIRPPTRLACRPALQRQVYADASRTPVSRTGTRRVMPHSS